MRRAQGLTIDVRGLQTVDRALRDIDPGLRRAFYRDLGSVIKARVQAAKKATPFKRKKKGAKGGHARTLTYLTKAGAKRDLRTGVKRGLFSFVAISAAPHASIIDLAQQGHSKQGRTLVATLNERYGPAPRFLGRQMLPGEGNGDSLYRESQDIVDKYVREVNARLRGAGAAGGMTVKQGSAAKRLVSGGAR
jgi:hypothetical protein